MGTREIAPQPPVRGASCCPAPLWDGAALILDEKGRICACRSGLPWPFSDTPVGQWAGDLSPEPLGRLLAGLWWRCADATNGDSPSLGELTLAAPDREPRRLSLRLTRMRRRAGHFALTVRDVSAQARRLEDLARRVAELERQRSAAENLFRGLAHDIRSPLAALGGFLDLLRHRLGEKLTERDLLALHHAQLVAKHLEEVLLSGLERHKPDCVHPTEVRELGCSVLAEARSAHPETPLAWSVEGPEAWAVIPGYDLWRVLWNLAENAVRYRSPEQPLELCLRVGVDGGRCRIELLDNGRGLGPCDEEVIFEKGRRGASSAGTQGTGLGLHQAKVLLERWGGRLWAERRPRGALFAVELPVARPSSDR